MTANRVSLSVAAGETSPTLGRQIVRQKADRPQSPHPAQGQGNTEGQHGLVQRPTGCPVHAAPVVESQMRAVEMVLEASLSRLLSHSAEGFWHPKKLWLDT